MSPPLFWTGYSPIKAYFLVAEKVLWNTSHSFQLNTKWLFNISFACNHVINPIQYFQSLPDCHFVPGGEDGVPAITLPTLPALSAASSRGPVSSVLIIILYMATL